MSRQHTANGDDQREYQSRRSWLKYSLSGAAAVFLAGCSGNGGSGDAAGTGTETQTSSSATEMVEPEGLGTATSVSTSVSSNTSTDREASPPTDDTKSSPEGTNQTGTSTGTAEILDRTMRHPTAIPPNDTNLNAFSPQSSFHTRLYTNRVLSLWDSTRGELSAKNGIGMATNWGFRTRDGQPEFFVEIKDGWKWSVGPKGDQSLDSTDVTAQDVIMQDQLERLMISPEDRPGEPVVTGWETDGKRTAIWKLREGEYNRTAQRIKLLTQWFWIYVHRDGPFGKIVEDLSNASEDEQSQIRQNVIQSRSMGMLEKPVSGPWRPIQVDNQRVRFELNTNDRASATQGGPLNFSNFELTWIGDTSAVQALGQNQISLNGDPVPRGASPPDNLHETDAAELGGSMIHIRYFPEDHEKSYMNKPKFRWAIAQAIDNSQAAKNAGRLVKAVEVQTGAEESQVNSQMPDLFPNLRSFEKDTEAAAQYLRDIGCSRESGAWMDPNGNRLTLPIVAKNISLWEPQAQTIASNLQNFGIQVELSLKDETTVDAQLNRHDFTVGMYKWGGFAYYPLNFTDHGWDTSGTSNERTTTPDVLTAPDPVGDWESSEMMEVNGPELFREVQRASDPSRAREISRKMCWAHNYNLPYIQIGSSGSGTPLNMNGKWNWPQFQKGKGTESSWSSWIDTNDHPIWAVDAPENSIISGYGPGLRANPDY